MYSKLFDGTEKGNYVANILHCYDTIFSQLLLGLFPVHEVEELACLHLYAVPCKDYLEYPFGRREVRASGAKPIQASQPDS